MRVEFDDGTTMEFEGEPEITADGDFVEIRWKKREGGARASDGTILPDSIPEFSGAGWSGVFEIDA